jgi:hypothetical protein
LRALCARDLQLLQARLRAGATPAPGHPRGGERAERRGRSCPLCGCPARRFVKLLNELSEPYRTMVELIAATGLRIGALLAVRWRALDLEVGTLTVRESVFEGKFQRPKTHKSRRTIPLGPHTLTSLKAHRCDRSPRKSDDDLVFPNKSGEPLRESKLLQRVLQPAAERAGLGRVTWHQFRHIHSSLLNDLRVSVKIARKLAGRFGGAARICELESNARRSDHAAMALRSWACEPLTADPPSTEEPSRPTPWHPIAFRATASVSGRSLPLNGPSSVRTASSRRLTTVRCVNVHPVVRRHPPRTFPRTCCRSRTPPGVRTSAEQRFGGREEAVSRRVWRFQGRTSVQLRGSA